MLHIYCPRGSEVVTSALAEVRKAEAPASATKSPCIERRAASGPAGAQGQEPGARDVARGAGASEFARAGDLLGNATRARADAEGVVSRRSLFGAGQPRALARRGGRQGIALARRHGGCDSDGARRQSHPRAARKCLERALSFAGAQDSARGPEWNRLCIDESTETRIEETHGSRSVLLGVAVRRMESAALPHAATRGDRRKSSRASYHLASSLGVEAARLDWHRRATTRVVLFG